MKVRLASLFVQLNRSRNVLAARLWLRQSATSVACACLADADADADAAALLSCMFMRSAVRNACHSLCNV